MLIYYHGHLSGKRDKTWSHLAQQSSEMKDILSLIICVTLMSGCCDNVPTM